MSAAMDLPATETVDTHALKVGDQVFAHGEVFQLTSIYTRMPLSPRDAVGFRTRLIRTYWCEMPRHWADDWHIQGNALARWQRVIP